MAQSYDPRAQTGLVVVELRGNPSRFWEHVVKRQAPSASLVEFGLAAARDEQLRDFDLFLTPRAPLPADEVMREFGHVRVRWVAPRKNLKARKLAHLRLRQLVPLPAKAAEDDHYSLADYDIDMEA